jgi:hypothetical protein
MWNPYSDGNIALVEAAFQAGGGRVGKGSVTITSAGQTYTVELGSMVQVNTTTRGSRQIRRQLVDKVGLRVKV